jgi:D-alanyl-D-alanine carboxypeptidase/D-alanyl-D-alanine-endopeptidase (penicillin-binding protein 4)
MTRVAKLGLIAFFIVGRAPAADLAAQLNALLDRPAFAEAQWGVKVCALDTGAILFARNPDKLLKPASNAKIYTAALALDRLGADFRIETSCYAAAAPDSDGTIHGDLLVYGRGDPSFSSRFNDGDYAKALVPLLDAIARAGVKKIDGDLIGDESFFSGPPYGADWAWDDLENYYGAPASALTLQDNVIDLEFRPGKTLGAACQITTLPDTSFIVFSNFTTTVAPNSPDLDRVRLYTPLGGNLTYVWGAMATNSSKHTDSVPVNHPALWFVATLKDALAQRGIATTGGVKSVNWIDRQTSPANLAQLVKVASVQSRPLSEIVKYTLKPSENLYAQLLLLQVGAHAHLKAPHDTEEEGLREMRRFLGDAGIGENSALLEEGSGLSRGCLVTPSASVQLLRFMAHHKAKAAFYDALPIAGVDGTLRNRFAGTAAARNVHAKTGSLEYVDTLSGYMTNKAGTKLVFSIMLNNYHPPSSGPSGHAAIDAVVKALADSQ